MGEQEKGAFDIPVLSKDPENPNDDKPKHDATGDQAPAGAENDVGDVTDMSEEDMQLKAELEMLVQRLREDDSRLMMPALEALRTFIRTATSSMTSVPKPLKFLRPFYEEMGKIRRVWNKSLIPERSLLASILSVLAMTYSDNGKRDTLYYRLISKSKEDAGDWGHEYVRHLAAEIGIEYSLLTEGKTVDDADKDEKTLEEERIEAEHGESRDFTAKQLQKAAEDCVGFFLSHNAEADAVDLLMEVEQINRLPDWTDDETYGRVCQYLVSCVPLLVPPDDSIFLQCAAHIYAKHDRYPEALALAVRLNMKHLVQKYFNAPTNPVMRKQLSYFLARSQVPLHWVHSNGDEPDRVVPEEGDCPDVPPPTQPDDIVAALGNQSLSKHFRNFGKAVGVSEPKSVEDIYKLHLEAGRAGTTGAGAMNSYRENLATTYVNAFVNAGFGNDKLLVEAAEGQSWIYKNKDTGMKAATASIGLSLLWDGESGIDQIDKYSYSSEEEIKAGALLATGILHAGIRGEPDLAWALLEDHIQSQSKSLKIAAMMGTAVSHANWRREDIATVMLGHIAEESSLEISAMAALTCGFTYVGSGDGEIASTILQSLMEWDEKDLDSEWSIFYSVALGLIFLGAQDHADPTIATLRAIDHPMARSAEILVDGCAWAGTGNVLKIQKMLHICAEHSIDFSAKKKDDTTEEEEIDEDEEEVPEPSTPLQTATEPSEVPSAPSVRGRFVRVPGEPDTPAPSASTPPVGMDVDEDDLNKEGEERVKAEERQERVMRKQSIAVIGIALIAMGEEVGAEMALRHFQHLMTYGEPQIRKAVPLALGLISASKPQLPIIDALSKYSHDQDLDVALNAIFAMGLVGAGTNNARLAQMLRQLAVFYATEADCLFVVRIAQGLVHMGKGTIGLNPFYHDGTIMSHSAMAGLLSVIISFTDAKSFILKDNHWMLYWLVTAMYPQFLIALDENDEEQDVTVRVGQAVDTVGLAGTRSGISGFQTHQTPVRIATGDRAELGTNEFFPYQPVLEGLVVLKKNEGFNKEDQ